MPYKAYGHMEAEPTLRVKETEAEEEAVRTDEASQRNNPVNTDLKKKKRNSVTSGHSACCTDDQDMLA